MQASWYIYIYIYFTGVSKKIIKILSRQMSVADGRCIKQLIKETYNSPTTPCPKNNIIRKLIKRLIKGIIIIWN